MSKDRVIIADMAFPTELAITSQEQEKGLMNVEYPPPVMSFIYNEPRANTFWMKNVKMALDIVFCKNNKVEAIYRGEPNSTRIIGNGVISDLVIELPAGTCKGNAIKVGDTIRLYLTKKSQMKLFLIKNGLSFNTVV